MGRSSNFWRGAGENGDWEVASSGLEAARVKRRAGRRRVRIDVMFVSEELSTLLRCARFGIY